MLRAIAVACISAIASVGIAATCGTGDKQAPASDEPATSQERDRAAEEDIANSAGKFARAGAFRLMYRAESEAFDGAITGDLGYNFGGVLYASVGSEGAAVPSDQLQAFLFLPPDLYVQSGDGAWFVQSPWDQGTRPDEQVPSGLEEPIINYGLFAADLFNIKRLDDESLDGAMHRRYSATIRYEDLQDLVPVDAPPSSEASVNLWLTTDLLLPRRIEIDTDRGPATHLELNYSQIDETITPPEPPMNASPLRDAYSPEAPCIGASLQACLPAQTDVATADDCSGQGRRVCLVLLGQVSTDLVANLVDFYRTRCSLEITVLAMALPPEAVDEQRGQIDEVSTSAFLNGMLPEAWGDPEVVLIALTFADLYDSDSHYRFVFGMKRTLR